MVQPYTFLTVIKLPFTIESLPFSSEINPVVVFSVILCKYVLNLSSQDRLLYQVLNKVQAYLIQVHTRGHLKSELK
jgi:hypothetical protein